MQAKIPWHIYDSRRMTFAMFYLVKAGNGCLLSCETAQELELIRLNVSSVNTEVNNLPSKDQSTSRYPKSTLPSTKYQPKCLNTTTSPKTRHQHVFQGVGKMRDVEIKLHLLYNQKEEFLSRGAKLLIN